MIKPRSLFLAVILIAGVMLGMQLLQAEAVAVPTSFKVTLTCEGQDPYRLELEGHALLGGDPWGPWIDMRDANDGVYFGSNDIPVGADGWEIFLPVGWIPYDPDQNPMIIDGIDLGAINDAGFWSVGGPLR